MKERVADYLLDISKLAFAGVVLSGIFKMGGVSQSAVLLIGFGATIGLAFLGFSLFRGQK